MKIALASDLHLEFGSITLENTENADVLVLSGDICVAHALHDHPINKPVPKDAVKPGRNQQAAIRFRDFFKQVSSEFPDVVYCSGNHEYYSGKWPAATTWLREECATYSNIHFLELDQVKIKDYVFVGGTLWTDMNGGDPMTLWHVGQNMNDFHVIRNSNSGYRKLSPNDVQQHHHATLDYIRKTVEADPSQKYVMTVHHAPTPQSIHPRYKGDRHMNGGYCSDLSEFLLDHPQIVLVTHGHVHDPADYYIGTTRVVCNPRGYIGHEDQADKFQLKYFDLA